MAICEKCKGIGISSDNRPCRVCGGTGKGDKDPYGVDQHYSGAKLDYGKAPIRRGLLEYFPRACLAVAGISAFGSTKYSWNGWKSVTDGINRYGDAEVRHICNAAISGNNDEESGLEHAAHEAWNALARLELILIEKEKA